MPSILSRLAARPLAAQERALGGVSLDYLRQLVRDAPGAFLAFARARAFLGHRGAMPADAHHVARIAATRAEDCGTCVQITVNLARQAGVPPAVVRAAALDLPDELPAPLAAVHRFATAVARADTAAAEAERPAVHARYGDAGIAELAVAIAGARTFPTLKRALGHAVSCERVQLDLEPVATAGR
jgi:alkylhydroperoxidase family enzyme